jgi:hypothetical protein
MLYEAKSLKGYTLCGLDGELGKVKEFFFDDRHWTIRYLVAETGHWLKGKQVLISPHALIAVNTEDQCITVNLTKKQIENSPPLSSDKPVSRQFEKDYYDYYGWPLYYAGTSRWGDSPLMIKPKTEPSELTKEKRAWDPSLRSMLDVDGYTIVASDGDLGCVENFIIDDETWAIRYLVVNTQDLWLGKKVLLAPQWIDKVNWGTSRIFVNFACDTFKLAADYTGIAMLSREYENMLFKNCRCSGYWLEEQACKL